MIDLKDRFGRFYNVQALAEEELGFTLVAASRLSSSDEATTETLCVKHWFTHGGKGYKFYSFDEVVTACAKRDEKIAKRKEVAAAALLVQPSTVITPPAVEAPKKVSLPCARNIMVVVGNNAPISIFDEASAMTITVEALNMLVAKAAAYADGEGAELLRKHGKLTFSLAYSGLEIAKATSKVEFTREF